MTNTITPTLRKHLVRRLNRVAELLEDRHPQDARDCEQLAARIAPHRRAKKTLHGESISDGKQKKAQTYRESRDSIRPAVFERAGNRCEAWHPVPEKPCEWERCAKRATIWDHWMGGTGRRRQKQSVATTWALCEEDNFARTHSLPTAAFWNTSHGIHCRDYGYPFTPHIEHAEVPRKSR